MIQVDSFAAVLRVSKKGRPLSNRTIEKRELEVFEAQERARRASLVTQQEKWKRDELIYQGLLSRRNDLHPTSPSHAITIEAAQAGVAYFEVAKKILLVPAKESFSDEAITLIAKRELKKVSLGVVREGHAFIVSPMAVKTFVTTFRANEASLNRQLTAQPRALTTSATLSI